MDGYRLELSFCKDEYQANELGDFENSELYFRITHIDMHPDDSFYYEIPSGLGKVTVGEVLEYVFPADRNGRSEKKKNLDVEEYGELPGLYDFIAELMDDERSGELVLDWSVNYGPRNIDLGVTVENYCSLTTENESGERYKTLHLVVEEYEAPFREYEDEQAVKDDKKEFLGIYLHYIIVNHGLNRIESSQNSGAVKEAIEYCLSQNLIEVTGDSKGDGSLEITLTNQGKKKSAELGDECDYYKDHYDIFSNVIVEDEFVDFEGTDGLDLRMAALRFDGMNPYRANMVINMFTGVFDDTAGNWEQEMRSEKFFARYLGGASVSEIDLTDSEFERVMTEGKQITGDID